MTSIQSAYGYNALFGSQSFSASGFSLGQSRLASRTDDDTTGTFAADIVSRISTTQATDSATSTASDSSTGASADTADGASKSVSGLEESLQRTMEHVQERYGKEAATALMGMVYQNIGDGEVTEEALGKGLLKGVSFIDQNFGMSEGDDFMSFLNNDLNAEMNTYFDNGLNERFFAVSSGTSSIAQSVSSALSTVAGSAGEDAAGSIRSLIESALADTESPMDALKDALAKADDTLAQQGQKTGFTALLAQNVAQGAATAGSGTGTLLNMTV